MKKERKESLVYCFPELTAEQYEKMKGKGAKNFAVFLTQGRELFVRCFHRYWGGEIIERQRYVFAKDGCVRYGSNNGINWAIRKEFREPVFCVSSYGYSFDNTYSVIGTEAIDKSDMRYSEYRRYNGNLLMCYLQLYCKHPNLEYLMKQGYDVTNECVQGIGGGIHKLVLPHTINWKSNNLLQMLQLNKTEFKLLKGKGHIYESYIHHRDNYPKLKPEDILLLVKVFGDMHGTLGRCIELTELTPQRLAAYIDSQGILVSDYVDYLEQCRQLKYDLHDTAISMPHKFYKMHERLSDIIKYEHDRIMEQMFKDNFTERKKLEFAFGDLLVRQPQSLTEIVDEGRILSHCVGGYAERHAKGILSIMFLRRADDPDTPYYTVEVSKYGGIVQCRGYKNNVVNNGGSPKPQEIIDFEKEYQQYLYEVFAKKNMKKERKSA